MSNQNTNQTYRFQFHLGDWSKDGHNQFETFVFESNYPVKALQDAYKASCRGLGVQFNHNANYSGLDAHNGYGSPLHIWTEYQKGSMSKEAEEILQKAGLNLDRLHYGGLENYVALVLEFVKINLPLLEIKEATYKRSELKADIPHFNGFWNQELNIQIGYGLFV